MLFCAVGWLRGDPAEVCEIPRWSFVRRQRERRSRGAVDRHRAGGGMVEIKHAEKECMSEREHKRANKRILETSVRKKGVRIENYERNQHKRRTLLNDEKALF